MNAPINISQLTHFLFLSKQKASYVSHPATVSIGKFLVFFVTYYLSFSPFMPTALPQILLDQHLQNRFSQRWVLAWQTNSHSFHIHKDIEQEYFQLNIIVRETNTVIHLWYVYYVHIKLYSQFCCFFKCYSFQNNIIQDKYYIFE